MGTVKLDISVHAVSSRRRHPGLGGRRKPALPLLRQLECMLEKFRRRIEHVNDFVQICTMTMHCSRREIEAQSW
jgi:hypothetical protein